MIVLDDEITPGNTLNQMCRHLAREKIKKTETCFVVPQLLVQCLVIIEGCMIYRYTSLLSPYEYITLVSAEFTLL